MSNLTASAPKKKVTKRNPNEREIPTRKEVYRGFEVTATREATTEGSVETFGKAFRASDKITVYNDYGKGMNLAQMDEFLKLLVDSYLDATGADLDLNEGAEQ